METEIRSHGDAVTDYYDKTSTATVDPQHVKVEVED